MGGEKGGLGTSSGELVRTQPTAGGLHAWVATVPQFGLQHQLLFSHLKAVYEQILDGHQWVETGINQRTDSLNLTIFRNVASGS